MSIFTIWGMTAYLVFEAVHRFLNPTEHEVVGKIMFIIACCGLVFNVIQISILHSGDLEGMHGHSHNCGGHGHSHGNTQEKDDDEDEEHGHSHAHSHGDNHKEDADQITVEEKYPKIILNESTAIDDERSTTLRIVCNSYGSHAIVVAINDGRTLREYDA